MRRHLTAICALAIFLTPAAPAAGQQPAEPAAGGCVANYVIGPDDVLDVFVWGNTEITRTVPVRPDGRISLPLVNDVQAAGLTPMKLRDAITKALIPYIPEPAVSVLVREVHSFKVTVIGQVKSPGRYEIKDRATVLDVLAMAGGLTEFAARSRIVVMREEGADTQQIPFRYDKLLSKNGTNGAGGVENFCVRPGDVILVP